MNSEQRKTAMVEFVRAFCAKHGFYPSVREIAAGVGLSSSQTAHAYLLDLVDGGRLERRQVGTNRFVWAIPGETP